MRVSEPDTESKITVPPICSGYKPRREQDHRGPKGRTTLSDAADMSADVVGLAQDGRLIAIQTDLGEDHLMLTSLSGDEAISQLFAYDLTMLSVDHAITAESLVGHKASVQIHQ